MYQRPHFVKVETAGLRQPENREPVYCVGTVTTLPTDASGLGKHADAFVVANGGRWDIRLRGKLTDCHEEPA